MQSDIPGHNVSHLLEFLFYFLLAITSMNYEFISSTILPLNHLAMIATSRQPTFAATQDPAGRATLPVVPGRVRAHVTSAEPHAPRHYKKQASARDPVHSPVHHPRYQDYCFTSSFHWTIHIASPEAPRPGDGCEKQAEICISLGDCRVAYLPIVNEESC